jgi:hypothetical protein
MNWAIPGKLPIFSEIPFTLFMAPLKFALEWKSLKLRDFYIGYDIRAPGFSGSKMTRLAHQPRGTLSIRDDGPA